MTIDPATTSLQLAERVRTQRLADLRRLLEFLEANPQLDPIEKVTVYIRPVFDNPWTIGLSYLDPRYTALANVGDIVKRARAKVWLARTAKALKQLGKTDKESSDFFYSLTAKVGDHQVRAAIDVAAVCTVEPVVDDQGQPVTEEVPVTKYAEYTITETRPVTRKVCPPSILAGLDVEV